MTEGPYYHLGMKHAPGCAPIMACGVHLRGSDEGSWDEWPAWGNEENGSILNEPRCPRCLESEYYGMCVLGDL